VSRVFVQRAAPGSSGRCIDSPDSNVTVCPQHVAFLTASSVPVIEDLKTVDISTECPKSLLC